VFPCDIPAVKVVILHDLLRCLSALQLSNSVIFLLLLFNPISFEHYLHLSIGIFLGAKAFLNWCLYCMASLKCKQILDTISNIHFNMTENKPCKNNASFIKMLCSYDSISNMLRRKPTKSSLNQVKDTVFTQVTCI